MHTRTSALFKVRFAATLLLVPVFVAHAAKGQPESSSISTSIQQNGCPTNDEISASRAGSQAESPVHVSQSPVSELLAQLRTCDFASCSRLIEKIRQTATTTDDLKTIAKEFSNSFGDYRSRLVMLINRLVQGDFPSHLINRMDDPSVRNILQKPEEIISAHDEFVQDWERFARIIPSERRARVEFLTRLREMKILLSECDCDYISQQLDELKLDDVTVAYMRGNAWLMLAFNYNYFYALSRREKVLNCLKQAIIIERKLARDPTLVEVAQKSLALEDAEFCTLFKDAGGKVQL